MDIDVSQMDMDSLKALRSKIDAILDGPADKIGSLDEAVEQLKAMKSKVADVGKAAVTKAIKQFLAAHPEVESLRWQQYTPYFNDGDSCEFSVRDPEVRLVGATGDEGDREDGYIEAWSLGYYAEEAGKPKPQALMDDLKRLGAMFDQAEDAMKATFGDHAQVTVGRDGDAEVEEYDHD